MTFAPAFLEELRSRVKVSEIVSASGIKLTRAGAEFKGLSPFNEERSPSFTVNDAKQFYHDFSSGKHGDVFGFLVETKGLSFVDAVKEIARIGGVSVPGEETKPNGANGAHRNGAARTAPPVQPETKKEGKPQRKIAATYDYLDADGALVYQVVRFEPKTFAQRIRAPGHPDAWLWSIRKGSFVRHQRGTDWYGETEERTAAKGWGDRIVIEEDTPHGLFNFPEIHEELLQPADERRTIFMPEGEKDCQTLAAWGVLASTNSGGAANWCPDHAAHFAGADVVILIDNDEPGRKRGATIAASLLSVKAKVRILDLKQFWPEMPDKADITDWRDKAGGDKRKLFEIVDKLSPYADRPFQSKFGFLPFERLDEPGPEHEYIIDGFLSVGDKSIIGGPSMSGKSFLAIHAAFCIALGIDFFGRKVMMPGLVIIQCGEGARGIKKRLRAWREHFGIDRSRRLPLVILQSKVDLFHPEGDTTALIEEIKAIAGLYDVPLVAVFIDTLATATGGADENSGRDMSTVMANIDRLQAESRAHVCLVHHLNAAGTKLRGHTSVLANIDQAVMVTSAPETKIRTAALGKQKDDEDGLSIKFELMQVQTGRFRKVDGKPETSCVCLEVGEKAAARLAADSKGFALREKEDPIFRAFWKAKSEKGAVADEEQVAKGIPAGTIVVHTKDFRDAYRSGRFVDTAEEISGEAIRKIWERNSGGLIKYGILGFESPYIWWTGKAIRGYPETSPRTDDIRTYRGQDTDSADDQTPIDF